jgi:hypothetical protein
MSGPERQSSTPRDRRVAVACTVCRRRRTRCDGFRPSCTYCTSKDIECIYTENQQIRKRRYNSEFDPLMSRLTNYRRTSAPDRASVSNIGPTDQGNTSFPLLCSHALDVVIGIIKQFLTVSAFVVFRTLRRSSVGSRCSVKDRNFVDHVYEVMTIPRATTLLTTGVRSVLCFYVSGTHLIH